MAAAIAYLKDLDYLEGRMKGIAPLNKQNLSKDSDAGSSTGSTSTGGSPGFRRRRGQAPSSAASSVGFTIP